MPIPDVFVTGVGIVSPAGADTQSTWASLLRGDRMVQDLEFSFHATADGSAAACGACVPNSDGPAGGLAPDRMWQYLQAAQAQAMNAAGIDLCAPMDHGNTGLTHIIGYSKTINPINNSLSLYFVNTHIQAYCLHKPCIKSNPSNSFNFSKERNKVFTHSIAIVAACATGTLTAIRGWQMICDKEADVVVCASTDASVEPLWLAAYRRLGVLADAHPTLGPRWACQPFDIARRGFAVGEGAAALVLESANSVSRRGVQPLACIKGCAMGTDPAGLTQLSPDGQPLAHVIGLALARAGCRPGDLACVYTHGTATPSNDLVECLAIHQALGLAAGGIPAVSLKGAIGHLMGAAGSVELAVACLALRARRSPGNVTLVEADPEFPEMTLPTEAFDLRRGPILKTSLGFGGHLGAVVLEPV